MDSECVRLKDVCLCHFLHYAGQLNMNECSSV